MAKVNYFEMEVDDPQRASDFFSKTFGWEFNKWGEGSDNPETDYWVVKTGGDDEPGVSGGMMRRRGLKNGIRGVIYVDDIEKSIRDVKDNGGEVAGEKGALPGFGWYAYFSDTEGNSFGLFQTDESAK